VLLNILCRSPFPDVIGIEAAGLPNPQWERFPTEGVAVLMLLVSIDQHVDLRGTDVGALTLGVQVELMLHVLAVQSAIGACSKRLCR